MSEREERRGVKRPAFNGRVCSMMNYTQKRGKRNVYYVLQCKTVRTTIPELCGMCPLTASDLNLHSFNNCSTQSVVVYCHSALKSSAERNTGTAREKMEKELISGAA